MCSVAFSERRATKQARGLAAIACVLVGLSSALGQSTVTSSVTVTNSFKNINAAIPDGSVTGLEDTRSVSLPSLFAITDLKVRLNVAGGYNGDLYCYLRHDSGFVVLLNRPGRSAANAEGSEQAGLQVCFRQDAAQDVHSYPNRAPAGARLVGEMAPDGRSADPRKC